MLLLAEDETPIAEAVKGLRMKSEQDGVVLDFQVLSHKVKA